jgi:hypothetical protein
MQQDSLPVQSEAPDAPLAALGNRWRGPVRQVGRLAQGMDDARRPASSVSRSRPILIIFILSGAAGLIYEVVLATRRRPSRPS